MRILMIIESLRDGGKQRRLVELLRVLSKQGEYQVLVLLLKNEVHYEEIYGFPNVELVYLKRQFRADPRVAWSFFRRAGQFNPDLVHSWGGLPAIVGLPYILLYKKPFVNGMIANSRLRFLSADWFRVRCTFPFSDVIISNSEIGLQVYKVSKNKGRLIRNGINFDRMVNVPENEEVRQRLEIRKNLKVVGMVATIDWRKNFSMYMKAAGYVLDKRDDVVFFIVGDGPDKQRIKEMVPSGKEKHFIFTGKVRNVEDYVSIFDVGVLASFGEGTSNSLLEYMLFEKPVVATNVFGINEVVQEGKSGFLVPQDDYEEMGKKIITLLDNKELSLKFGRQGRDIVSSIYSIDQMVTGYENIYKEVVKL
ncbi:glycosyltransferase family 4 protein [Thermophagus sp. OGC60D27]|uniref:glycosyltransferase family 4 protein n=1 Tax=Thermophagus sp. OGC60D27 TaxID=3458415 RepID=UPI004037F510